MTGATLTGPPSYFAAHAWLPGGLAADVRISVERGRFTVVAAGVTPQPNDVRLPGVVLPGFANTHSHAFHRALRGRTHDRGGTFWTWREQMYAVASRLEPDTYLALARATFAEMALAGVTSVGEFHYVHHRPDGQPYDDPNAMGRAVIRAAREAGLRITLLDTCYLAGGFAHVTPGDGVDAATAHVPLDARQTRFGDGSAAAWAARVRELVGSGDRNESGDPVAAAALSARRHDTTDDDRVLIGAAIHSVRAVPREELATVVAGSEGRPLHVHLSEQPAENEDCLAAYGLTPTQLLDDAGALTPDTTVVHATHLSADDIETLGSRGVFVSFCPTTERDLADGIGPARALADAGARLVLGSDQHAVIDLLEEARALEMHERLASRQRGRLTPAALIDALTLQGQRSIGWDDAGRIEAGARADLVAIRLDTPRTAGSEPAQVVLSASSADIDTVIVDGRVIVRAGQHILGDIGALLADAIAAL